MRKIYFFICILCGLSSAAQNAASNGLQTQIIEEWVGNAWRNLSKNSYTSNANGYFTNILGQSWDVGTSSWENASKVYFTNTPTGNISYIIDEYWNEDDEVWENDSKEIYQYGTNGQPSVITLQFWDGEAWENSSRTTYTYNTSGKLISDLGEMWEDGNWKNYSKSIYTLNAQGNPTQVMVQLYSDVTNLYSDYIRRTYTYNASNLAIGIIHELKSEATWINSSKSARTFDMQGRLSQELLQSWQSNNWVNAHRVNNTYSALSIGQEAARRYTVYPNPAQNILYVDTVEHINKVSIIGVDGKSSKVESSNGKIDVSGLAKGIYILSLETEHGTGKTKFIKL